MVKTYLSTRSSGGAFRIDDGNIIAINIPTLGAQYDIMAFPGDGAQVVSVGRTSSIFKTNDSGNNWTAAVGNYTELIDNNYFEVWIVNDLVSYVVGEQSAILKSIDGGITYIQTIGSLGLEGDVAVQSVHFINEIIGVIRISNKSTGETYVLKTIDSGNNWTFLNGGSGTLLDNTEATGGLGGLNTWSYGGIHMSEDETIIHVLTKSGLYRSNDSGVNFVLVVDFFILLGHAYGLHLTWINDNEIWATGIGANLWKTIDAGVTWIEIQPVGAVSTFLESAHFVENIFGYLGFNYASPPRSLLFTADGGTTSLSSISYGSARVTAIWTIVTNPCYELVDCEGLVENIQTGTDLSEYIDQVITLADATNHEIKGCWLVTTAEDCIDVVEVAVYKCYELCEDCLPTPLPPEVPCPRPVDPGYSTGLCDPNIVENSMCTFSEMVYQHMMSQRYKIDYCCLPDEENVIIKFEKIQIKLRESESLVPDPCNPKCFSYEINIISTDSAVTTYVDCFEVAQVIITPVDADPLALPRMIGFCALDTSVPTTVVTHPDDTTDTYILERVQDCVPPYVVPIACTGYQVRMTNYGSGLQRFRYMDCNGEEVIISLGSKQGLTYYYFCGIEGQTILRELVFFPEEDIFLVNLVPCTVEPPCTQYTFTLNSELPGVIEYIGCDNIWTEVPYVGDISNQVIIVCGQPYQTFPGYAPYFNYFEVIETGSC